MVRDLCKFKAKCKIL